MRRVVHFLLFSLLPFRLKMNSVLSCIQMLDDKTVPSKHAHGFRLPARPAWGQPSPEASLIWATHDMLRASSHMARHFNLPFQSPDGDVGHVYPMCPPYKNEIRPGGSAPARHTGIYYSPLHSGFL